MLSMKLPNYYFTPMIEIATHMCWHFIPVDSSFYADRTINLNASSMKARQKILIACDTSISLVQFRGDLIKALLLRHDVSVFTPQITDPGVRHKLEKMGVRIYENSLHASVVSLWSDLHYLHHLYKIIRSVKPDVFFPYALKPVIYGSIVARLGGVAKITPLLSGLGYNFSEQGAAGITGRLTRVLLRIALADGRRTRVIFQNSDDCEMLKKQGVLRAGHFSHVVNGSGVNLSEFCTESQPQSATVFLMIARLINAKGISEYYEAARRLKCKYPQLIFRLVGAYGPNIDKISDELYRKIIAGNVIEYLGEVKDIKPLIKEASVIVLPSYYREGVPRCLLESMAMGRAIITCDSVGCRETVRTGDLSNGFLISPRDVSALANAIEQYVLYPALAARHGMNSRQYATDKFDVHNINSEMLRAMDLL